MGGFSDIDGFLSIGDLSVPVSGLEEQVEEICFKLETSIRAGATSLVGAAAPGVSPDTAVVPVISTWCPT